MRFSKVTSEGKYVPPPPANSKASFSTMTYVRATIVEDAGEYLARAVTIAVRLGRDGLRWGWGAMCSVVQGAGKSYQDCKIRFQGEAVQTRKHLSEGETRSVACYTRSRRYTSAILVLMSYTRLVFCVLKALINSPLCPAVLLSLCHSPVSVTYQGF